MSEYVRKTIRDIPDFPKKGIIFRDITTQYRLFYNMVASFSDENGKGYMKEPMLVDVTELARTMEDHEIEDLFNKIGFFADKIEYKK